MGSGQISTGGGPKLQIWWEGAKIPTEGVLESKYDGKRLKLQLEELKIPAGGSWSPIVVGRGPDSHCKN